jgi:hypothetical protein
MGSSTFPAARCIACAKSALDILVGRSPIGDYDMSP